MRSAPTPRRLSSPPVLPANSRKRSAATRPPGRPAPAMRGSARSPAKWSRPVISTADMGMTCPMPIMPPAATPRTGINARLLGAGILEGVEIRRLDGRNRKSQAPAAPPTYRRVAMSNRYPCQGQVMIPSASGSR